MSMSGFIKFFLGLFAFLICVAIVCAFLAMFHFPVVHPVHRMAVIPLFVMGGGMGSVLLVLILLVLALRRRRTSTPSPQSADDDAFLLARLLAGLDKMEGRMNNLETILDTRRRPATLAEEFDRLQREGR
jgi:phage shock protein B